VGGFHAGQGPDRDRLSKRDRRRDGDGLLDKRHNPIYAEGALAVLRDNLAPHGCVMTPSAAASHLLKHSGPALVFDNYPNLKANIDRDDPDVTGDLFWCYAMADH
jgi:dihydroxyacid dehydratase/phosphogluconate dehydratase